MDRGLYSTEDLSPKAEFDQKPPCDHISSNAETHKAYQFRFLYSQISR